MYTAECFSYSRLRKGNDMAITEQIGKYKLTKYVGASSSGVIFLYNTNNATIANLYFGNDNRPPPASSYTGNKYVFYYRARDWPHVVDILRNEKPLFIHWFSTSGYLGTDREPVGEEENPVP